MWVRAGIRQRRLVRRRVRRPTGAVNSIAGAPNQGSRPTCRARADRKADKAARHHGLPSLLTSPPRRDSPPLLARPQFAFVQAARPGLGESLATSLARDFAQVR